MSNRATNPKRKYSDRIDLPKGWHIEYYVDDDSHLNILVMGDSTVTIVDGDDDANWNRTRLTTKHIEDEYNSRSK